jgi:hypothetical protein
MAGPDGARLEDRAQLEVFLATVLAAELREMPGDQHGAFVTTVCDRLPEPAIDFVRLQIEATLRGGLQARALSGLLTHPTAGAAQPIGRPVSARFPLQVYITCIIGRKGGSALAPPVCGVL